MPPSVRRIPDPEAEMERLAAARNAVDQLLCHGMHQVTIPDGRSAWVEITVAAKPVFGADPSRPWPFPVRADLAERIAAMIRADCEAETA